MGAVVNPLVHLPDKRAVTGRKLGMFALYSFTVTQSGTTVIKMNKKYAASLAFLIWSWDRNVASEVPGLVVVLKIIPSMRILYINHVSENRINYTVLNRDV